MTDPGAIDEGPERVIFIAGVRRSGTTLLNHILCTCAGAARGLNEVQPLTHLLWAFAWCEANYERMTGDFFGDPDEYLRYRADVCREFVRHAWRAAGRPRTLVLKNPELSLHLAALLQIWPQALVVGCVRDPRDQIASEFGVHERRKASEGGASAPPDAEALARSYVAYAGPLVEAVAQVPTRILLLRYEDLVEWSADVVARVSDFTGVDVSGFAPDSDWNVAPEYLERLAQRPSFSPNYGRPVTRDRVGRYLERLTAESVREIEHCTQSLMAFFDYATD